MRRVSSALRAHWPTILTAVASIAGWLLITHAIAQLAPARIVWPLSLGVLCLALPGLKNLRDIFADGLHSLMLDDSSQESDDA